MASYAFGPFVADRTTYRVLRDGRTIDLTPKLLDLLFYLLERPATLVTKEALLGDVWPGANVTDNALAQAISELREALGDRAGEPTYIRTVARRGYRFIAPVHATTAATPTPAPETSTAAARAGREGPGRRTIAVLDFTNVTGDQDIRWLASGIAETVTSDLAGLDAFHVVDRWRVVQAGRGGAASAHDIGAALGLACVVVGSYQRQGPNLRITARLLDLARGAAIADAKLDGPLAEAFALQDGIVAAFVRDLGLTRADRPARTGARETASLEAFRAYTEGLLKVESLDTDLAPAAILDFERALRLDPHYAVAHTGLANAQFIAYETSRLTASPDESALADGIEHARRAIRLDASLAEAHATLSFLLVSAGQVEEARAAAVTAVGLEPDNWRHQYRLGHAHWGDARLRACQRALAIYPQFAYARFEMAMVFVARRDLEAAEDLARTGAREQDRQAESGNRFPAIGFHWLLGAIAAARGDVGAALEAFDRELAQVDRRQLYGPEYGALSLVGRGHALLAIDRAADAVEAFRRASDFVAGYPRGVLGVAIAEARRDGRTMAPRDRARGPGDRTRSNGSMFTACEAALLGDTEAAIRALERGFADSTPTFVGWAIPIEPAFFGLRQDARFARVLDTLASRAT